MNSLQSKANRALLLAFLLTSLVFAGLVWHFHQQRMSTIRQKVVTLLQTLMNRDRTDLANELFEGRLEAINLRLAEMVRTPGIQRMAIYDDKGQEVSHRHQVADADKRRQHAHEPISAEVLSALKSDKHLAHLRTQNGELIYTQSIHVTGEPLGYATIVYDMKDIQQDGKLTLFLMSGMLLTMLVCNVIMLGIFFSRNIIKPIVGLQSGIKRIREGDVVSLPVVEDDEIGNLTQAFNDMSAQRKQDEESLRVNEQRFRNVFNATQDAMIIHDQGDIIDVNDSMLRMYDLTKQEALELNVIDDLSSPDNPEVDPKVWSDVLEGQPRNFDWMALHPKEGKSFPIHVSLQRVEIDGKSYILSVVRDLTAVRKAESDRARLEDQLRQSQKMDAIGQLAGGVAHDFNNMLGGIIGGAELLQDQLTQTDIDRDACKADLDLIVQSSERAADLAGSLLAFARRQSTSSTPVDVHQSIRETVAILEKTIDKKIEIRINLAAEASMVVGDGSQLQSVFMNLGINGAHAMQEVKGGGETYGGLLQIDTMQVELTQTDCDISMFDLKPGPYIEVAIRDEGTGIAPEDLERIFEPFYTTKTQGEGTGLGLAAAYGTVVQHHGAIVVYSEPGVGTSFQVLLPLTEEKEVAKTPVSQPVKGSGTILVIDDERVMRAASHALLEGYGYTVLVAENGLVGLERFEKYQDEIDLVVMDMIMPEMDGRECFHAIQKLRTDIPVILASGFTRGDDLTELKDKGLAGFIRKPFRGVELSVIVAEAIERSKP